VHADCGALLGLCEQKNILACLAPAKKLCQSAGHYAARSLYGSMAGLVGMAPYQPDGRQTKNILLMQLAAPTRRGSQVHCVSFPSYCFFADAGLA
jgi:hypothetical protein